VVRDVHNSTSRAAASRLGTKTTRNDLLQALLEKLDIDTMAKELGYSKDCLVQRYYVTFKIKENVPIQLKVFPLCGTWRLQCWCSFWIIIPHQTPQRETSFAFGGCSDFWKYTQAQRWGSTASPGNLCLGPPTIGWSFEFVCCINITFWNTLVELAEPVCSLSPLCWVDLLPHFGYAVTRYKTSPRDEGALHDGVIIDALVSNDAYLTRLRMVECVQLVKTPSTKQVLEMLAFECTSHGCAWPQCQSRMRMMNPRKKFCSALCKGRSQNA